MLPGVYSYVLQHPVAFKFRQMQFNASSSGNLEVLGINFVDRAHNIPRRNVLFAGNGLSYFDDSVLFLNLKQVFGYWPASIRDECAMNGAKSIVSRLGGEYDSDSQ